MDIMKIEEGLVGEGKGLLGKGKENETVKGGKRHLVLTRVLSGCGIFIHMSHQLRGQEGDQRKGGGVSG